MHELTLERASAQNAIWLREQQIETRLAEVSKMQREIQFYRNKLELIDAHHQH